MVKPVVMVLKMRVGGGVAVDSICRSDYWFHGF